MIINRDLKKELISYTSQLGIIQKLATFKIIKFGKYMEITKKLLCDPNFLKLAYHRLKFKKLSIINRFSSISYINDIWFDKIVSQLKQSQYKFKLVSSVLIIGNFSDLVIQQALLIVLSIIYERDGIFFEASHGFRENKSCHTALKQIKFGWSDIVCRIVVYKNYFLLIIYYYWGVKKAIDIFIVRL